MPSGRVFCETQRCIGFQFDAANQVVPDRDADLAAARGKTGIERFLESGGVLRCSVTGCAKRSNIELNAANDGAPIGPKQDENDHCQKEAFHLHFRIITANSGTDV